jgi:hypothetical protein
VPHRGRTALDGIPQERSRNTFVSTGNTEILDCPPRAHASPQCVGGEQVSERIAGLPTPSCTSHSHRNTRRPPSACGGSASESGAAPLAMILRSAVPGACLTFRRRSRQHLSATEWLTTKPLRCVTHRAASPDADKRQGYRGVCRAAPEVPAVPIAGGSAAIPGR